MGRTRRSTKFVSISTALALLVGTPAYAQTPAPAQAKSAAQQPMTLDVTLGKDGLIQGYVVDAHGVPAANVQVRLSAPDGQVVATTSDDKGRFGYRGLAGGAYQMETDLGVVHCRAWTAQAAPPRSAATILLVHDENVALGQWAAPPAANNFVGRMKRVMTNPFAVATIVGAAVAIPVAIHNANQDDSSS